MKKNIYIAITAVLLVSCGGKVPEAVDLGLSVRWASFNIGAKTPEGYGDYYAWGETEPKNNYISKTYKWCNGSWEFFTKYNSDNEYGAVDNKVILEPEDDVAHVKLGGKWRMPTDEEWTELRTQCKWTWTTEKGVKGFKVTGKNDNSIFLPVAGGRGGVEDNSAGSYGLYWSSSLGTDGPRFAWFVGFSSGEVVRLFNHRCYGLSVRPVLE